MFFIIPEKDPVALLSPIVSVGVPLTPSIVPLPESPFIVWLRPPSVKVPLLTTFPFPVPFGICVTADKAIVVLVEVVVFPE